MAGYDIAGWSDFSLAQLGASAALLGLVFVGLSINLRDVVSAPPLVHRAGEAVAMLATVLVSATLVLIPDQERGVLTAELLVVAAATFGTVWRFQVDAGLSADPERGPPPGSVFVRRLLGLGAPAFLAVAAITLSMEAGGGLYWWPPAVIAAYLSALSNAWVLLIEIER